MTLWCAAAFVSLPGLLAAQPPRVRAIAPMTVQTTARIRGESPQPVYPPALRASGGEGEAILRFLVDTAGRVDPDAVRVISTTHPLFAEAATVALLKRSYVRALQDGRPARQWIQERFVFRPIPPSTSPRTRHSPAAPPAAACTTCTTRSRS
ncbi:MAG: TonB family protein [Gemmatimonadaceae bacterium]|nr:TonB family protein [Gemmatimonadaceae bacterium]